MPTDHPPTRRFMKALWGLEHSQALDALVDVFADGATLDTIAFAPPLTGKPAIEQFWREYLAHFNKIATTFARAIETPDTTVLEWHSDGELANGSPIHYRGVTILHWQGDRIKSFRAYYDSAAFVPEFETHLKRQPRLA